jgi:hypothetical protein
VVDTVGVIPKPSDELTPIQLDVAGVAEETIRLTTADTFSAHIMAYQRIEATTSIDTIGIPAAIGPGFDRFPRSTQQIDGPDQAEHRHCDHHCQSS